MTEATKTPEATTTLISVAAHPGDPCRTVSTWSDGSTGEVVHQSAEVAAEYLASHA